MRFAVVGATSWGCTLSWLLAGGGHEVALVCRDAEEAGRVAARRGLARLPEVVLPPAVSAVGPDGVGEVEGVIVACPAQSFRDTLGGLRLDRGKPVLSAAKGIEQTTMLRLSQVLEEIGWEAGRIAVMSGPNLAHEIVRGLPAAAVVASVVGSVAEFWQRALSRTMFRVYTLEDVVGVEIGGATKNVVAIAAGAAAGLGFGANTVAAVMTRGLAEMTRLGVALGADPLTFQGLAGVGDLSATCFSPLSRNRRLGELLARGKSLAEALAEIGEVVEGVATAPVAVALARKVQVELPIAEQVAAVVAGEATVGAALASLLGRAPRPEQHGIPVLD